MLFATLQGGEEDCSPAQLDKAIIVLKPLYKPKEKPGPGDWLAVHKEPGQSFRQYLESSPVLPDKTRNTMYIQALGEFSEKQSAILSKTCEFLALFYNIPVKQKEPLPLSLIPASARRTHPGWGDKQILSTYVLDELLPARMPKDAALYFAFTTSDLWPGGNWNFVFGQASLYERVGVWSLYRFGNPAESKEAEMLCLRRTLGLAIHEAGHSYAMRHCTAYECAMAGSNSLRESDKTPLFFCPECMAKLCWASKVPPLRKYQEMQRFFETAGLKEEAAFCGKAISALDKLKIQ